MGCLVGVQTEIWETYCMPFYQEIQDEALIVYVDRGDIDSAVPLRSIPF